MNLSHTRTARGAVALLTAALLAGCTGDPGPILTETPTGVPTQATAMPSASGSPTATVSPLTDAELLALMPPEAAYTDIRGAIATAEFFLLQYPLALESGDLRAWDALSLPGCIFCGSVRDHVLKNTANGEFETGNALNIDHDATVANYYDVDGFWYVTLQYQQEASTLHLPDGTTSVSAPSESGSISLRLTHDDEVWRISDVGVDAK